MSKADALESAVLNIILAAKSLSQVFDNAASSAFTGTWTALHTADPGDAGSQNTSELAVTAYARVLTTRSTVGWTVSAGSASPVSAITFPQCTSTSTATVTHFSVGSSSSGAGTIWYSGTVSPNISIGQNVTPSLSTASAITED